MFESAKNSKQVSRKHSISLLSTLKLWRREVNSKVSKKGKQTGQH